MQISKSHIIRFATFSPDRTKAEGERERGEEDEEMVEKERGATEHINYAINFICKSHQKGKRSTSTTSSREGATQKQKPEA